MSPCLGDGGCNPVSCQDGILSYGKRRKREAVYQKRDAVIPVTKNSLVYDVDLGQEILISNTPLSREIFVEAGTKVDAIRDAAGNPVLAGRDSSSGEMSSFVSVCRHNRKRKTQAKARVF